MSYFATPYTIHFDDTMAYGSHHFLTGFKFQCAAREALLYGDLIFDQPGVPEALETIHLFTADAYSRNLSPTFLGDRVAILITLEEWGRVSARFCYRVMSQKGQPICAGFQTMICSDAKTGNPIPLPEPIRAAFDQWREITEPEADRLFRDQVLSGTEATMGLFADGVRQTAIEYLTDRYPHPRIVDHVSPNSQAIISAPTDHSRDIGAHAARADQAIPEVWVFPGQGAFDASLLSERVKAVADLGIRQQLAESAEIAAEVLGGDASALVSGSAKRCHQAVAATPALAQVAIHLQSTLGAVLRRPQGEPAVLLGHSFGEIAALGAAGCFDLLTGVRVVCERTKAVDEFAPPDGALLVVMSNRQLIAEEITVAALADSEMEQLIIAGRNHDRQTVVSGPAAALDRFRARLKSLAIDAVSVPSPTCFHHPLLREAAEAWFRRLQRLPLSPPQKTVYSPIGRQIITTKDDIASILSSQFLRPFDLQGAIDDLVAGGFTRFVDCGSSGSLSRLLQATAPESIEVLSAGRSAPQAPSNSMSSPREYPQENTGTSSRPTVAIVGQGCLLPGGATSPTELHNAITQGRSGIFDNRELDDDWERDFYSKSLTSDRSTSGLVGLVNDADLVVPHGIDSAVFAEFSRTQQLLCCALAPCLDALRAPGKVLCLLGTTADGFQEQDDFAALRYAEIGQAAGALDRLGNSRSAIDDPYTAIQEVLDRVVRPGLDLTLVDAACASSLYAVTLGMQALEKYEADIVLAGGLFCPGPGNNCLFSQFGGLTATGCRPFDAGADGVVFSEGAAVVVLQREVDAEQSGQSPIAVLRGAGLSSDGRSSSANVPQTAGQRLALKRCYTNYEIDPRSVVAIEAHGTSTPVGDATELTTLHDFFAPHAKSPVLLHSLKGLLGHTGWAAGTASIIAATQMLEAGVFPAQANHRVPSEALSEAQRVLHVPTKSTHLRSTTAAVPRIAIDGFGFGGSNAHVVIEPAALCASSPEPSRSDSAASQSNTGVQRASVAATQHAKSDELVVVAWHQLQPTSQSRQGLCFDRAGISLPDDVVVLPDLADDMDVSQRLTLSVVGQTLAKLPTRAEELRCETGLVLALGGKTERAVEATARVLAPRLARKLGRTPEGDQLNDAIPKARPSGPYTLQCMMPNVSAGRAALQFDLNGPNFVVDAGGHSLEAAFRSAGSLVRAGEASGTKLVVVAAIDANRWPVPGSDSDRSQHEYAAAFAVTTRAYAKRFKLDVVVAVDEMLRAAQGRETTAAKLTACLASIDVAPNCVNESEEEFSIHVPVWVHAPRAPQEQAPLTPARWLIIAEARQAIVDSLLAELPVRCDQHGVLLVGPESRAVADRVDDPKVTALDLSGEALTNSACIAIDQFEPDVVVAVGHCLNSSFDNTLGHVCDNRLCEAVFLTLQQLAPRIEAGATEVWALFPGAWNGVIHPATGALSGLFKATQRELPAARLGVVGLRSTEIKDALAALQRERSIVDNSDQDILHDGDRRLVRRLRVSSAASSGATELPVLLDRHSVVVATGGARGVTAIMAEALLRDYGCTVIALGRSPLEPGPLDIDSTQTERDYYAKFLANNPGGSPIEMKRSFQRSRARWEAQRTIEKLSRAGGRIRYLPVDITQRDQVERAIAQVAAEFGTVDLVVHGAGIQWSKKLGDRSLTEFRQTFDVKLNGLRHMVGACRRQFGKTVPVHALTSAYSIFGNDGQHDYGAANESMDRLCDLATVEGERAWTSIAWSAWDGIGMTRGSEYKALAEKRNLALLDAEAGQRVFRTVMSGRTGSSINVPLSESERTRYRVRTIPAAAQPGSGSIIELPVQLTELRCLPFHKARGAMTLPGAWTVDYMVRATLALLEASTEFITVEDMQFLRFVRIANGHDPDIRVIVEASVDGCDAWLVGNVVNPSGIVLASNVVFARAKLRTEAMLAPSLGGSLKNGHGSIETVRDPYCAGHDSVSLSGPFDCLPEIQIGPLGRRATFQPAKTPRWGGTVPALLLDASLRVAGMHVVPDALHVPIRMDRVVLPTGLSTDSRDAAGWQIRTGPPSVRGDDILCDRVEVTDEAGALKLCVEGALVTRLR